MILIKKIISCIVIDLEETDVDSELVSGCGLDVTEDVAERSRNDTSVGISLSSSRDGKCLT